MEKIIELLMERFGARNVTVVLLVLQAATSTLFAHYKSSADATLTATQVQGVESVRRAIDQAAAIAAQDAEMAAPVCNK